MSIWDNILTDHPIGAAGIAADEAGFDAWIGFFIEANATNDNRHELLDFICHARKPKKMKVQAFYIFGCVKSTKWLDSSQGLKLH
jgi:hypothetical protein